MVKMGNNKEGSSTGSTLSPNSWKRVRFGLLVLCAVAVVLYNLETEAGKFLFLPTTGSGVSISTNASIDCPTTHRTSTSTSTSTTISQDDKTSFPSHKIQAAVALRVMQDQERMTTQFTTRDLVLEKGFPSNLQWKPCVLERILQQKKALEKDPTIHIALVGGSTAARPGSGCPPNSPDGRHGAQLHQKLQHEYLSHKSLLSTIELGKNIDHGSPMKFEVHNYAQGGTTSVTSSLLLDGYLNPSKTDIIIWDFLVNDDASGGGKAEQVRKLDFWLTRVYAHFQQAGKPPPPIVLLCLWGNGARSKLLGRKPLDLQPHSYFGPMLEAYNQQGWNIAMINVGAVVNGTTVRTEKTVSRLLDDTNHASCAGTSLMADMIQHLFYTNILASDTDSCAQQPEEQQPTRLPLPHKLVEAKLPEERDLKQWTPLWQDLFRESARIGSLSMLEPTEANQTNLHMHHNDWYEALHHQWPSRRVEKHVTGRDDIKRGWILPHCNKNTTKLHIFLKEPQLKWIGLSIGGAKTHIYVNGVEIQDGGRAKAWCFGVTRIGRWINLQRYNDIPAPTEDGVYTVSFCHSFPPNMDKERIPTLDFFIAVMVPPDDDNDNADATTTIAG